ncbi:VOC family protein [Microbacterium sp. No. 7]|uniref:VOC family protein n=1 Tax=Microbacterium sp. No. 7 TaxID=1714373 RepID=UPI0006CFBD5E|nr:hypothetical protein [Microbacterium sp. No. 7]ALJ21964.1 hypothetical protein AOA12_19525 [Microbacterium sp. No. 7]
MTGPVDSTDRPYAVRMMFHPTLHVPSLDEAEEFYERVFGRPSTNISTIMAGAASPNHATDYSTFTAVADVLLDTLDPRRYVTDGEQRYPDVAQGHLKTTGWYVDGVGELYAELRRRGIRVVTSKDVELTAPEWPGGLAPFHSLRDDAGIRYHFFETFPFPADPRCTPGWTIPPVQDDDPLGIVRTSHHTIVTSDPDRALRLTVDVLGGTVIHTGRDELRDTSGPYVQLADAVIQYATADEGSAAAADAADEPFDTYHAITFTVVDLDRVQRHLEAQNVGIARRTATGLVTDPATSLGIPWGFTTDTIPGDARVAGA